MITLTKKKFYVTTPIYYINAPAHIGHAYATIAADIVARWHRLKGEDVFFLTGTDENSQKNVEAAREIGEENIQKYCDEMSEKWKKTWKILGISNSDFIRTTEERHKKGVVKFFKKVYEKGDIFKGKYEGFYCVGCEAFITKSDLVNGLCPIHKTEPKLIKEENYFFKASRYKEQLLKYIEENPDFIQPEARRNEVVNYIKEHFGDISISRQSVKWGIPLPIDKNQVIYVWFDALINYLTGIGYGWDEEKFKKYWPADLHIIGKDIIKFHCALWPAMLLSADLPLPKKIFAHGFFTVNGEKISKSLGNIIDPLDLTKKYPIDALRYFLIKEIPFGEDGDFSEKALIARINGELVSDLGNLIYRVLSLAEKYSGKIEGKDELSSKINLKKIAEYMDNLELHNALGEIWNFIRAVNKYINEKEPWKLKGKELANVLYNLLEASRVIAILISPFLPATAEKINEQLGVKPGKLKDCKFGKFKGKIKKGEYLFRKIEE